MTIEIPCDEALGITESEIFMRFEAERRLRKKEEKSPIILWELPNYLVSGVLKHIELSSFCADKDFLSGLTFGFDSNLFSLLFAFNSAREQPRFMAG